MAGTDEPLPNPALNALGLTVAQWVSLALIVSGAVILSRRRPSTVETQDR